MLRLWRTRRVVAMAAVFVLLGLGVPILDHFLPELLKHAGGDGVRISVPALTPAQALSDVDSNFAQLGTLVVIIIAAATLALDAHPAVATFYRSRARRATTLVLPRWMTTTLGAVACLGLGILAAWYETAVLIGAPPARAPVVGFALQALWVAFSVSTVAVWASIARGVLAVAAASLATLFLISLLANTHAIAPWAPSTLSSSMGELAGDHPRIPWHALVLTVALTPALVTIASRRLADLH